VATGLQAAKKMERVTRKSFSALDRLQRALKQGGKGQVPHGGRGGGKNAAHYTAKDLMHFGIGLAADPISEAPEQVEEFANLRPWMNVPRRVNERFGRSPVRDAFVAWSLAVSGSSTDQTVPGDTLGDALSGLIDWLSRPEGADLRSVLGQNGGMMCLDLVTQDGYEPSALFRIVENDHGEPESYLARYGVGPRPKVDFDTKTMTATYDPPRMDPLPPGTIKKTVRIPYAVFEALADLWADTRAHMERVASTSSPPSNAETENAALPGAAPIQDYNSIPGSSNPEHKREREVSQARSSRRPGPLGQLTRSSFQNVTPPGSHPAH
jgi:hypothetical protein